MPGVIKTYKPSQMAAAIRNLVGGTKNILYGTTSPSSNIGNNGDIYLQTDNVHWDSELEWGCLPEYYVKSTTQLLSTHSKAFYKTVEGGCIAVEYHSPSGNWYGPILFSTVQDYVKYTSNEDPTNSVVIDGTTWYISSGNMWYHSEDLNATIPSYEGTGDAIYDAPNIFKLAMQTYNESASGIIGTYAKVNGVWQVLIGTDINDVNTEGDDDWQELKNYIESSGTQYIDTGYIVKDNTVFECVANVSSPNTAWASLYGSRHGQNSMAIFTGIYGSNREAWVNVWNTSATEITGISPGLWNTKSVYRSSRNNFGAFNSIEVQGGTRAGGAISTSLSTYLFALNMNGDVETMCICKLYRFRIYEGDALVHEFIPWQDNGVACLKDTVTGNIKYNAGTGDFVYGTDS